MPEKEEKEQKAKLEQEMYFPSIPLTQVMTTDYPSDSKTKKIEENWRKTSGINYLYVLFFGLEGQTYLEPPVPKSIFPAWETENSPKILIDKLYFTFSKCVILKKDISSTFSVRKKKELTSAEIITSKYILRKFSLSNAPELCFDAGALEFREDEKEKKYPKNSKDILSIFDFSAFENLKKMHIILPYFSDKNLIELLEAIKLPPSLSDLTISRGIFCDWYYGGTFYERFLTLKRGEDDVEVSFKDSNFYGGTGEIIKACNQIFKKKSTLETLAIYHMKKSKEDPQKKIDNLYSEVFGY